MTLLDKITFRSVLLVLIGIAVVGFAVVAGLMAFNGVDTSVTQEDREVIATFGVGEQCESAEGFEAELECVESVQQAVFEQFPDTSCEFQRGETEHTASAVAERGYGCCYDRATLIEQTLRDYGFEVRRVGLWERQSMPLNYLKPGINSHALSEVKTERGWMAVESLDPIVGIDEEGEIYDVADIREGLQSGEVDDNTFGTEIPSTFFNGEYVYGRGVYSRHGYFFEPHIPVPEVSWEHFQLPR